MLPLPLRAQPVLALPRGSFVVLGPVDRRPVGQFLSKRISLLRLHMLVFIVSEPLRVVLVMGFSFLVFVVRMSRQAACQLLKSYKYQQVTIFSHHPLAKTGGIALPRAPTTVTARPCGNTRPSLPLPGDGRSAAIEEEFRQCVAAGRRKREATWHASRCQAARCVRQLCKPLIASRRFDSPGLQADQASAVWIAFSFRRAVRSQAAIASRGTTPTSRATSHDPMSPMNNIPTTTNAATQCARKRHNSSATICSALLFMTFDSPFLL